MSKKQYLQQIRDSFFGKKLFNLEGTIVEIGYGKGQNFKYYSDCAEIIAIDPKSKIDNDILTKNSNKKITVINDTIYSCEFPDNSIDYVVGSFVLCSIRKKKKFMKEIDRVLKVNGRMIFFEHTISKKKFVSFLQNIFSFLFFFLRFDCRPNSNPLKTIISENLKMISYEEFNESFEPYIVFELKKTS